MNNSTKYFRFKNGTTMIAKVLEKRGDFFIVNCAMDLLLQERQDYTGLTMTSSIPFGIEQEIRISSFDLLFMVDVPSTLLKLYYEQVEYTIESLLESLAKENRIRKEKEKHLH